MKNKLMLTKENLTYISKGKMYIFNFCEVEAEKRVHDYKFVGDISVCDYDHRNDTQSNESSLKEIIISKNDFTSEQLSLLPSLLVNKKVDHTLRNLTILFMPLILLIVIFITLNIITK